MGTLYVINKIKDGVFFCDVKNFERLTRAWTARSELSSSGRRGKLRMTGSFAAPLDGLCDEYLHWLYAKGSVRAWFGVVRPKRDESFASRVICDVTTEDSERSSGSNDAFELTRSPFALCLSLLGTTGVLSLWCVLVCV